MAKYTLRAILEAQVINKLLPVIVAGDKNLEAKIAGMGTRVGSVNTWAEAPLVDQNGAAVTTGDTFVLTSTDGDHPSGIYSRKPDNSGWNDVPDIDFDALGIEQIKEQILAGDGVVTKKSNGTITFGAAEGGKGITLADLKEVLNNVYSITNANKTRTLESMEDIDTLEDNLAALATTVAALDSTYHPKGGAADLVLLNEDAEEGTKESVNASQLDASFTVDELQAKYDTVYGGGTLDEPTTAHIDITFNTGETLEILKDGVVIASAPNGSGHGNLNDIPFSNGEAPYDLKIYDNDGNAMVFGIDAVSGDVVKESSDTVTVNGDGGITIGDGMH